MTHAERLSAATLAKARNAELPSYDRGVQPAVVHLGVGAFARAHLGVYADDLLRQGWPTAIRGISLRSETAQQRLGPQDGLYTVVEREPGMDPWLRVVGAFTSVETGGVAAVASVAAASTRLVTLTVTEKAYAPGDDATSHVPTMLAAALAERRRAGAGPLVIASLDNLSRNGDVLRRAVLAHVAEPTLAQWIADNVQFPCSVVDRIVPATTADDLADVAGRLGLLDSAAVTTERHRSWVITDTGGSVPLGDVGVDVVGDITAYERRKLWLLNAPHSTLAYCGLIAGCDTIATACADDVVAEFTKRVLEDILEVADLPTALDPTGFARDALRRFANPHLRHTCLQVAADGSQKLRQRLLPVVELRRQRGLPTERQALVVAAWLASVAGLPVQGRPLPVADDPAKTVLRRALSDHGIRGLAETALGLDCSAAFVGEVTAALEQLRQRGFPAVT